MTSRELFQSISTGQKITRPSEPSGGWGCGRKGGSQSAGTWGRQIDIYHTRQDNKPLASNIRNQRFLCGRHMAGSRSKGRHGSKTGTLHVAQAVSVARAPISSLFPLPEMLGQFPERHRPGWTEGFNAASKLPFPEFLREVMKETGWHRMDLT